MLRAKEISLRNSTWRTVFGTFRWQIQIPGLYMEEKVLSEACYPIWSGMQPVRFRQECEVPGCPYPPTTNATLCRRFSSLRPAQIHISGYPLGSGGSIIVRMEDKHKQIRPDTNGSDYFPGTQSQALREGNLHKGDDRKASTIEERCPASPSQTIASARVITRITGYCIAIAKVIMPAKLCLWSLYLLLRRKNYWEETMILPDDCLRDLERW